MPDTLSDTAAVPAALSAFLRGVERRGALFGELQCGDREAGDTALAAAMRAFRNHAVALPMAEWPRRFWTLLLATPQLRRDAPLAKWTLPLEALAGLAPDLRHALLLRLAAGLAEDEAAAVLGVAATDYQQALARACPRDASGEPDAQAWRELAEAIQQQLRDLPPERLARLASLREAAIASASVTRPLRLAPSVAPVSAFVPVPRRRRWPWIVLVLMLCAAALAMTWWWPQWQTMRAIRGSVAPGAGQVQDAPAIRREALPPSQPASRFDAGTALLTHPDFELVLDSEDEALARQADFLAWVAATATLAPEGPAEVVDPTLSAPEPEHADAQL